MDKTSLIIAKETEKYIRALDDFFIDTSYNLIIPYESTLENLIDFIDRKVGRHGKMVTSVYAKDRISSLRKDLMIKQDNNVELSPDEYHSYVTRYLFFRILSAYSTDKKNLMPLPMSHHWMSRCYVKRFAQNPQPTARVLHFQKRNEDRTLVPESLFIHDTKGFYPYRVEYYFSLLESDYNNYLDSSHHCKTESWGKIVSSAFYLMQQVRMPGIEVLDDMKNIRRQWNQLIPYKAEPLSALMDICRKFEDVKYLSFVETQKYLVIAPLLPSRIKRKGSITSTVFPMERQRALVMSNAQISQDEAVKIVANYNNQTYKAAEKYKTFVL